MTEAQTTKLAKQRELGEIIEARLNEKRWSVTRLSRESGVSRAVLYKVFKGEQVTLKTYLLLCEALDLELTVRNL
jgi:DNA-binding Xre family transcriptional regulator